MAVRPSAPMMVVPIYSHVPDRPMDPEDGEQDEMGFSAETRKWLGGWLTGGAEITTLPDIVVNETMDYRGDGIESRRLYKALVPEDLVTKGCLFVSSKPSSWTYSLDVAIRFKSRPESSLVSVLVGTDSVLVDTVELDINYMKRVLGGFPGEHEVILLPGSYRVEYI
jgi:hypothetical protein